MYRILILPLLAIAITAFAADNANTILQATAITEARVALQWTPIESATKYKVFYDESALVGDNGAEPLFDTAFVTESRTDVTELSPSTEYTFIVHGFDDMGRDVGESIPLHASTFAKNTFAMSGSPITLDDKTTQITFTLPVDLTRTEISVEHSDTKKAHAIDSIQNSKEDLRSVIIHFKNALQAGQTYDLVMKKVTTTGGLELSPENRTRLKIIYGGEIIDQPVTEPVASSDPIDEPVVDAFDGPVPIDSLPKTGPNEMMLLFLLAGAMTFLIQKKLSKRV